MGRPGRKRRLVLEDEYWKLIGAGVGTVEACRRLGIGRTTGYYWRAQRGGLPRTVLAEDARSGRFLCLLERERIAVLREQGCGVREIARRLGRAPSTVSRELRRYALDGDDGVYRPGLAHSRARERGRGTRRGIFTRLPELHAEVQAKLDVQWSPEQVAAWLRVAYPSRPEWHVCHETIYQGLYFGGADGFSRNLTQNLRTGRSLRRPRRTSTAREPRFRAPSKSIRQRPVVALERSRVGDFEGDLIVGRYGRSVIGTLVDRTSRFVRLVHVPTGQGEPGWRGGEAFAAALAAAVADLSPQKRLTLTWDQGVEMARHDLIAHLFPEGVFFADAGQPWQRGTNENSNGLLRQYLPRSADLDTFSRDDLDRIEELINHRPRKTLGWNTPARVFTGAPP
jgi:transposase, IS30 family